MYNEPRSGLIGAVEVSITSDARLGVSVAIFHDGVEQAFGGSDLTCFEMNRFILRLIEIADCKCLSDVYGSEILLVANKRGVLSIGNSKGDWFCPAEDLEELTKTRSDSASANKMRECLRQVIDTNKMHECLRQIIDTKAGTTQRGFFSGPCMACMKMKADALAALPSSPGSTGAASDKG